MHDLERKVIARLILRPDLIHLEGIEANLFLEKGNRRIFEGIERMATNGHTDLEEFKMDVQKLRTARNLT